MKKKLALLLAILMLATTVLVACGPDNGGKTNDGGNTDIGSTGDGDHYNSLAKEDLDGATVKFLAHNASEYQITELGTGSMNDVVYKRNQKVMRDFNFKMEFCSDKTDLRLLTDASEIGAVDVFYANVSEAFPENNSPITLNLCNISTIDLSDPWWNQNVTGEYKVGDMAFIGIGDVDYGTLNNQRVIYFNKENADVHNIEYDFYGEVLAGTWTWDDFGKLAKSVTYESSGDNFMDENDNWGVVMEGSNRFYDCVMSTGVRSTTRDENGDVLVNINNEEFVESCSYVWKFINYDQEMVFFRNYKKGGELITQSDCGRTITQLFSTDRNLFLLATVLDCAGSDMRNMESEYGILPLPKYNDLQERYYSPTGHGGQTQGTSVALITADAELTGTVITALYAASGATVIPQYYENALLAKGLRGDENNRVMLELITETSCADIGYGMSFMYVLWALPDEDGHFASYCASNQRGLERKLKMQLSYWEKAE